MKNDIILINFVDLALSEKKMVLSWRNSENIKIGLTPDPKPITVPKSKE